MTLITKIIEKLELKTSLELVRIAVREGPRKEQAWLNSGTQGEPNEFQHHCPD